MTAIPYTQRTVRLALVATLLLSVAAAADASIIRVTPTGATSGVCGASWASPCDLHYGLDVVATAGDQIWVKAGTYKPSTTDIYASFRPRNNIALYGGFAGTESVLSQRDFTANVTTLSGDSLFVQSGTTYYSQHVLRG